MSAYIASICQAQSIMEPRFTSEIVLVNSYGLLVRKVECFKCLTVEKKP